MLSAVISLPERLCQPFPAARQGTARTLLPSSFPLFHNLLSAAARRTTAQPGEKRRLVHTGSTELSWLRGTQSGTLLGSFLNMKFGDNVREHDRSISISDAMLNCPVSVKHWEKLPSRETWQKKCPCSTVKSKRAEKCSFPTLLFLGKQTWFPVAV